MNWRGIERRRHASRAWQTTIWACALSGALISGCDEGGAVVRWDAAAPTDAGSISSPTPPSSMGTTPGMPAPTADAGAPAPVADAGTTPPVEPDPGTSPAEGGTMFGQITRSGSPRSGGIGHIYVALFDADPVRARDSANLIVNVRIENADMSSSSASIPYELAGIPTRAAPYYVVAFLDDNGTVSATEADAAGPDRGDLISLDGFSSPTVLVNDTARQQYDIDLNFNRPF